MRHAIVEKCVPVPYFPLIAATAIENGLSLASANVKHFGVVKGLELVAFEV